MYDENKRRYYSKGDHKVSSSASKAHDRRWEQIPSWANGGVESVYRLALPDFGLPWIARYATADFVRDTYAEETGRWASTIPDLLNWDERLHKQCRDEDWSQAFSALDQCRKAYIAKDYSHRVFDCWQHNSIENKRIREEAESAEA